MRYTGSTWKKSRRFNFSLLETGKELEKRPYGPGQHGAPGRRKKNSEYGKQLIEKQKLRDMYGVNERQFRRLFLIATKSSEVTGYAFMKLLESRLDNMVYRLGFARTRRGARQLVNHGHIEVNGKKVDIPSTLLKVGDVIALRENSRDLKVVKESLEVMGGRVAYVEFDAEKLQGKYLREPTREELPRDIAEAQIVEYYNMKL